MTAVLPEVIADRVGSYLARAERIMPGAISGLYIVGSVALGAFRPARSDIDLVVVVDRDLTPLELQRLRAVVRRRHDAAVVRGLARRRWPLLCNACYVRAGDLARPPLDVEPVAAHVSREFEVGRGFDVNPVTWRILGTAGIAVRGPAVAELDVHQDDAALRRWNLDNLNDYWRHWAAAARSAGAADLKTRMRHVGAAWGVLGAPRLHYTIATGDIASKERAGEYALDVFDERWQPLLLDALAYWRGEGHPFQRTGANRHDAADFVDMVIESANQLPLPVSDS